MPAFLFVAVASWMGLRAQPIRPTPSLPDRIRSTPTRPGAPPTTEPPRRSYGPSGLDWTFLRNATFAEFELGNLAAAIASGELITNVGSGKHTYDSRADCAAAAGEVITSDGHAGRAYDVTDPELI